MASYTTSLPLFIEVGVRGRKKIWMNLNKVFGMHHQQRNQVKKRYDMECRKALQECPLFKKCRITYTVFKPTKRRYDVMNVVAVVDKFLQDTLVGMGRLPDDNYDIVPEVVGKHGGIDKQNPRVEVTIEELECSHIIDSVAGVETCIRCGEIWT